MLSLGKQLTKPSIRAVGTATRGQRRPLHSVKDFGYDVKRGIEPVWEEGVATLHYNHYLSLVDKLNKAIANTEDEDLNAEKILQKYSEHKPLYDLAAEIVNHEVMWFSLKPGGVPPSEKMEMMLNIQFGGFDRFLHLWKTRGAAIHGSGWLWLVSDYSQLDISYGFNAGTPKAPVVGLLSMDVWEHAYFTQYGTNRKAYIDNWVKAVNWDFVEKSLRKLYPDNDFDVMLPRGTHGYATAYVMDDTFHLGDLDVNAERPTFEELAQQIPDLEEAEEETEKSRGAPSWGDHE